MNTIESLRHELLTIGALARYADRLVTAAVAESVCVWCDTDTMGGPEGAKIHILACEKAPHRAALAEKDAQIAAFDAQVANVRNQADAALARDDQQRLEIARLTQEVASLRSQLEAREGAWNDPPGGSVAIPDPVLVGCKCGTHPQMLGHDAIHSEDLTVHTPTLCTATGNPALDVSPLPEQQLSEEVAHPAIEQVATPAAAATNDGPPAVAEQVALPVKPRRGRPPDVRCRALGCPSMDATKGWPGSGAAYFCGVHGPVTPVSVRHEWNRIFRAAQAKKPAIEVSHGG